MCIRESRVCPQKPRPSLESARARGKGDEACEHEGSSLRCSTLQIMQSTRSTAKSTSPNIPHGRVCGGGGSPSRDALALVRQQFHRFAVWILDILHFTQNTTHLPHTQLACGISTRLIVPRNVDGQDFLPAQRNALGHSPNTHVPLYFALCYHRLYLSPATASALPLDTSLSDWACSPMPTK